MVCVWIEGMEVEAGVMGGGGTGERECSRAGCGGGRCWVGDMDERMGKGYGWEEERCPLTWHCILEVESQNVV